MEYFYAPPEAIQHDTIFVEGEEFSHLTHVMRKRIGDIIHITDGCGSVYQATIESIVRRTARCTVASKDRRINEPATALTLAVALLKNPSRFETMVEKTVELGVARIVPLLTTRTISWNAKTERWAKIAVGAMKQSLRCVLPTISGPVSFSDFLAFPSKNENRFIPHQDESQSFVKLLNDAKDSHTTVCIGPEGGFTDEEIAAAVQCGFQPVSLGPRRLRSETAAIAAASLVLQ